MKNTKKILFSLMFLAGICNIAFAQGEANVWEPQTNVSGYIATEFNYFSNLKFHDRNYGLSITEAGLLLSYKPLEKLAIKTIFVYRPDFSVDMMLNEINGEYSFNNWAKFKFGRFLTPLSPMNTYYYAPVNNSATIPLIISHHAYFPLNIDGIDINGKIGDDLYVDYDGFVGGFRNALWVRTGALKMFGYENTYLEMTERTIEESSTLNEKLNFGYGGHVGLGYADIIDIGFGIFRSNEGMDFEQTTVPAGVDTTTTPWSVTDPETTAGLWKINKFSYGGDLTLKLGSFKLLAEAWHTKVEFPNLVGFDPSMYKTVFVEASNNFSSINLTPYFRYEYNDAAGLEYSRITGGLTFRPIFPTLFKVEYMHYDYSERNLDGIIATAIFAF
jgi:hypothetical protein